MSREVVIVQRCDTCREPATQTFVVGAISGEAQPRLHLIDVCELHAGPLIELEGAWSKLAPWAPQAPLAPRPRKSPGPADGPLKVCDLCGETRVTRQGLGNHIWTAHVGVKRPYMPLECPDCGRVSETAVGASMHRQRAHGYDMVTEAYAEARKAGK
jgi:predicted RNA-binding Zn-ribbon protein involved in translation (DUF1610 family)